MKKIVSLLSVFAIIFTTITTVVFAADNEIVFTPKNKTTTSVDIEISANTTRTDISSIALFLDISDATDAEEITVADGDAAIRYVAAQKMITLAFKPLDNHKYVSGTCLGTITIKGISKDFSIKLKPTTNRTTTKISTGSEDITSDFGTIAADIKMVETPTEKAAVKGNEVNGSQMFSTSEAITMPTDADVTVTITNDKVTDKKIEETVGTNGNILGSGTTKFIPIVSYKIGDTTLIGSIFTIKVTSGENNLGTWTYTVPTE